MKNCAKLECLKGRMKAFLPVILFSMPLLAAAMEVQPGDTLATVRTALGAPRGQVSIGERHLLYYDRGEVELRGGAVARVALRSTDEQAVFAAERSATQQKVLEENAREVTEGLELKAHKLSDSDFRATPLAYQVVFWESFAARYPGVSCRDQLTAVRLRLAEEQEAMYPQSEPEEVVPEQSDYVFSSSPPYSSPFGYSRNQFGLSSGRRFSNTFQPLQLRPPGQFNHTSGDNNRHGSAQASLGAGGPIRP
jgi:hypothetical protein